MRHSSQDSNPVLHWAAGGRETCADQVDGKRFERCNFLVLRPVLLKIAYFNSVNQQLSMDVLPKELRQRKIVDPSIGAPKCSVNRNFSKFSAKKLKELQFFYLFTNPAETTYLGFRGGELSNAVWLVQFRLRKVAVHTFFGVSVAGLLRPPSPQNYRKP